MSRVNLRKLLSIKTCKVGACDVFCVERLSLLIRFLACCRFSNAHWFWSGLETLLLGGTCATVAFTIGYYVNGLLGAETDGVV